MDFQTWVDLRLVTKKWRRRELAAALDVDPSALSRSISGLDFTRAALDLRARIKEFLADVKINEPLDGETKKLERKKP